jgi:uncharacterized coiled-coil protein SlyX
MTEVPSRDTQLDRIEAGVNQLNQRMARLEERQNSQGAKVESHDATLVEYGQRIRQVELELAVNAATGRLETGTLKGRWAVLGAVALAILGAVGAAVGKLVTLMIHPGS